VRTRLLLQILPIVTLAIVALTAVAIKVASDHQKAAVYADEARRLEVLVGQFTLA